MATAAGPAAAGFVADIGIDAQFQAFGVDIVGEGSDTGWKFLRVRMDKSLGIALSMPAIVNIDILVPGILHAVRGHGISHPADDFLIHIALEFVPTVPAHGRRLGKERPLLAIGGKANRACKNE
jgi:hypothetical protein